jgi:DNA-binding transcriptional ArsR family regulator
LTVGLHWARLNAMVWRIHFTADDLARIQVSPTLGPLAETVMALWMLRCPSQPPAQFGEWRAQVKGRLTAQMAPLTALIPLGSGVDLCMLTGAAPTIEKGLQALLAMPREHVLAEMEYTDRTHRLPAAAWAVAEADGPARRGLAAAARIAHRALVEPYWTRIHACLHAEQVARGRMLASGGPDRLLSSLQGELIRWRPPVLELGLPCDREVHLGGRGIALIPSVFVGKTPRLHLNPNDESTVPWLVMPLADGRNGHRRLWDHPRGAALAALVGRNRAAVLRAIADGCTTTELASRVGISLAAASQHASVLRDAGLIITRRQGSAVLHVITPLGADLLRAG